MDFLDANQVEYRQENNTISVPTEEYQNVKLLLAREGLTDEPSNGEDILMKDMGFGVSQRLERERLKYGREQQIAKTIDQLQSINRSKVLLAIPRENVFARQLHKPPRVLNNGSVCMGMTAKSQISGCNRSILTDRSVFFD